MKVLSEIPANPIQIATNEPFRFKVKGIEFEIKPFSLYSLIQVNKKIHASLMLLYYNDLDINQEMKNLVKDKIDFLQNSKKIDSIVNIIVSLIEPINPLKKAIIIANHNKQYWFSFKKWVVSLKKWFVHNLSLYQILELGSYFIRYCTEIKKKIFLILQEGIEKLTNYDQNSDQTSQEHIEPDWKQGYQSLGSELLGLPLH